MHRLERSKITFSFDINGDQICEVRQMRPINREKSTFEWISNNGIYIFTIRIICENDDLSEWEYWTCISIAFPSLIFLPFLSNDFFPFCRSHSTIHSWDSLSKYTVTCLTTVISNSPRCRRWSLLLISLVFTPNSSTSSSSVHLSIPSSSTISLLYRNHTSIQFIFPEFQFDRVNRYWIQLFNSSIRTKYVTISTKNKRVFIQFLLSQSVVNPHWGEIRLWITVGS